MAANEDHPLIGRARDVVARLEGLEEVPPEHEGTVIRTKAVMKQLVASVEGAHPLLLSVKAMDALSDALNKVESSIPALEGDETTATVADLASGVEDVLYRLSDLLHMHSPEDVGPVKAAIQDMAEFSQSHLAGLKNELDSLRRATSTLESNLKTADEKVANHLAQVNSRLQELSAAIDTQRQEIQTALSSQQTLFETEQEQRQTSFSTTLKQMVSANDSAQKEMITKGEAKVEEVHKRAEHILGLITKRKKEVEATAEAVGLTATISGFSKYADQQKESADRWRWVAVGALLGIVLWGVVTLFVISDGGLTLQRSVLKGSVGVALAILAGYAGKQSGHHRREERRSRRLGLEVAAFDPYVANLDPTRQKALKEFMALRVFGHLEDPDTEEDKWGEHQPSVQKVLDLLSRDKPA